MPSGSGESLGVEVGRVWRAGAVLLPRVSGQLDQATPRITASHTLLLKRGGGIGADPSSQFDELQTLIRRGIESSSEAIQDCGRALVWAAEDYQLTDQAARDAYDREKKRID